MALLASYVNSLSIPEVNTSPNNCYVYITNGAGLGSNLQGIIMAVAVWGGPGNVMYIDETSWHYKCAREGTWAALFKGDMPRQLPGGEEARANISKSCMSIDYGAGEGNFRKMLAYLNHSNTGEDGYRLLAQATKQVWQLSDDMSSRAVRQWAHYDQLRKPIAGVHIRAGDKWNEDKDNAGWHNRVQWTDNLRSLAARNSIDDVKSCLLMGDSWPAKWNATRLMQSEGMTPSLHIVGGKEESHSQIRFNKKSEADACDETKTVMLEIDALARADIFIGSMNSNVPRLVALIRGHVYDKEKATFADASGAYRWHHEYDKGVLIPIN